MRLKSVKNIQKITKSMKMVSAAKYAKSEKDLKLARPYGVATTGIFTIKLTLNYLNYLNLNLI
jgi:F-type H+-transporting ATPase subunit gamma